MLLHRVRIPTGSVDPPDMDTYIDTENMLSSSSKAVIYKKLPCPYTQTLFVELVKYTPGDTSPQEPSTSSRPHSAIDDRTPRHSIPPSPHHHQSQSPELNRYVPPPPPWSSRWSNAATAASPPTGALSTYRFRGYLVVFGNDPIVSRLGSYLSLETSSPTKF